MPDRKLQMKRKREPGRARKAILFELENLAVDGHRLAHEALKSVFKAKGVELPPAVFSRFCVGHQPKYLVTNVLRWAGKERLSGEKLAEDVHAALKATFSASGLKLEGPLKRLLEAAAARNVLLGALSGLDRTVSDRLTTVLGLKEMGVQVFSHPCEEKAPIGVDGWLKLARTLGVDPTRCVVLATTARSTKAALAARMRCVAIPCAFTGFEDLGGADYVVDSIGAIRIEALLALLEPTW